ncbi:MAG: sugar ABC transporter permease, partial [Verrucomicrobia bacterium]|nr:sugar ABC transporter permease [Verrucomicrobiota bacterium]
MAKDRKAYSTGARWFVGPAMIVLLAVGIIPLLFALWTSFQQFLLPKVHLQGSFLGIWPIFDAPFVWLSNYRDLLFDESFRDALGRSLLFLVINLPIQLGLGLFIALMLHKPGNDLVKNIARVALVIPMATTFAVVGLMGRLLFNSDFGINDFFWNLIFGHKVQWLADPNLAFLSVSVMDCWQWTPFCALVLFSS